MNKKDIILFELILQEEKTEDITDNLCKEIELLEKEDSFYHSFFGFDMTEIWKFYDKMKKDINIIYIIYEFILIKKGIQKSFDFKIKDILLLFKTNKDRDKAFSFSPKV